MYRAVRFPENPLLHAGMDPRIGTNLNGPSLIRVPDWVAAPLGRYYLYFAHHQGTFIRMAYADEVRGLWTVYRPGVLSLEQTPAAITSLLPTSTYSRSAAGSSSTSTA